MEQTGTILFHNQPSIIASAAVVGKKEGQGPLASYFDYISKDTRFSQTTWEKAESKMQQLALDTARDKGGLQNMDIGILFAGDLLNQCIGSSFSVRETGIPFLGLYGACSTMAEGLLLSAMAVDGGYVSTAAALTSSHFAGAERQYRMPLTYGGQRPPTAQWTVTGAGCAIVSQTGQGPYIHAATVGSVADYGVKDANQMGAAMAPAACDTIGKHLNALGRSPDDYDLIVTGDLGSIGKQVVYDFFKKEGILLQNYDDCGCMIYDAERQDVHAGGSGCGCSAVTLCGYLMKQLQDGQIRNLLFCATGALLSPLSAQQGNSIPGICHAISISRDRR